MKIMIWADGGCNTGFGNVTHNLASRWQKHGHDVHVLAINYSGDPWHGNYKLYTTRKYNISDVMGYTRIKRLTEELQPDILFLYNDLPVIGHAINQFGGDIPVPSMIYTSIDGVNIPASWRIPISKVDTTVAMSKFGQTVIKNELKLDVESILHGVEHDSFWKVGEDRPIKIRDEVFTSKQQIKESIGLQDKFVVFAINRNSIRKNYYDTFKIFNEFRKRHDDAILFVHAAINDEGGNLLSLVQRYDLDKYVRVSDLNDISLGVETERLNLYYNLADVKLSTSMGEGFGLTDAEAIACGTPVVAQNFSATTEVVGNGGILIEPERHFTTANIVDMALPDVDKYVDALDLLYNDYKLRMELSRNGVEHAKTFDWDRSAWQFEKLFDKTIKKFEKKNKGKKVITAKV